MTDTTFSNKVDEILEQAIIEFGFERQIRQFFEESAELQQALCKFIRYKESGENQPATIHVLRDNVQEEMADVMLTLRQLVIMFDSRDNLERIKLTKLNKLRRHIEQSQKRKTGDHKKGNGNLLSFVLDSSNESEG